MKARFNFAKLRSFLYSWHGGQYSAVYAVASSGLVEDVDALKAELLGDAQWCEANPRAQKDCAADARYIRRLIAALDGMLSLPFTHPFDNRVYRAMPWAEKGPTFQPVALRRDKATGQVGLFWYDDRQLSCYFHVGQHSTASREYMHNDTVRAYLSEADTAELVAEWNSQGPVGLYARPVARIKP